MRFEVPKYDISISLEENEVNVLSVENPDVFTDICRSLWNESNGQNGVVNFSDNNGELSPKRYVEIIWNPFDISCNSKKILESLYSDLSSIAIENHFESLQMLSSQIVGFIDDIASENSNMLTFDLELNLKGLLKLCNVKIEEPDDSDLAEYLSEYIRLMRVICGKTIFICINLKQFLSEEDLMLLYADCFYEKVHLIILEGQQSKRLQHERGVILDKDLCIIKA